MLLRFILLLSFYIVILIPPVSADVIEFNDDGSVTKYLVDDYIARGRSKLFVPRFPIRKKELYRDFVAKSAQKYSVKQDLIEAVILVESGFNQNATSHKGAMGLMQLMPATAKSLGVNDAYNPQQNIDGGTKYLAQLLNIYKGDTRLVLAAYNAGESAVNKYNGVPPYAETQNYVRKIEKLLDNK